MKVYSALLKTTITQYFVYRLNFILWRFRVVLNLLIIYFLWHAIYQNTPTAFGYSRDMMLTYVLLINFLSDLVFSNTIHEIGIDIRQGGIMQKMLKPIPFFTYLAIKELGDKLINICFSLLEIIILLVVFKPQIVPPHDSISIIIAIGQLLIGMGIAFFLSFSVAMIAFWTAEIWAPRFIYIVIVVMLAGSYFPLDILPSQLYNILLWTPFPYIIFIPVQTYLKGISSQIILQLLIGLLWGTATFIIAQFVWKKGMREYSFYGR